MIFDRKLTLTSKYIYLLIRHKHAKLNRYRHGLARVVSKC